VKQIKIIVDCAPRPLNLCMPIAGNTIFVKTIMNVVMAIPENRYLI
jgi:hypothetical protein